MAKTTMKESEEIRYMVRVDDTFVKTDMESAQKKLALEAQKTSDSLVRTYQDAGTAMVQATAEANDQMLSLTAEANSKKEKSTTESHQKMLEVVKTVNREIVVDTEDTNKKAAESTEKAADSAEKVKGKGEVVKAAFKGMGGALLDIGQQAMSSASEMQDAMGSFAKATGVGKEELGGYEDVLKNIYANNYGESFDDIATSMASVKEKMGDLEGTELQNMTESALALRDTFGFDVAESVDAANRLMSDLGISGEEAMNLIARGADEGLLSSDDLLGSLGEYSGELEAMAGDADTAAEAMAGIKDAGTGDLQSQLEGVGRAFETMLLPLGEALLPIVQEVIDAIVPLTDAFKPIIESILPVITSLLDTMLGPIGELIENLLPPMIEFIQSLAEPLADLVESLLPPLFEIFDALSPVLQTLVEEILPVLGEMFSTLVEAITPIIDAIMPVLVDLFAGLAEPLNNLIEAILPPLLDIFNALVEPLTDIIMAVLPPLLDLLEALIPVFADIINAIAPVLTVLGNLIATVVDLLMPVIQSLADIFGNVLTSAIDNIMPVVDSVTAVFKGLMDFIKNIFSGDWEGAWDSIVGVFKNLWEGIKNIVKAPINFIIDGINGMIGMINNIKIPDWVPGIGGLGINIPKIPRLKGGIDYVPGDFFPAFLDEGERVLTKEENLMFHALGGLSGMQSAMQICSAPALTILLNGTVNMDGRRVGVMTLRNIDSVVKSNGG